MKTKRTLIFTFTFLHFTTFSLSQTPKEISKMHKEFNKHFSSYVYVPSGAVQLLEDKDSMVSFRHFYMSQGEVSNQNYSEFLEDIGSKISKDSLKALFISSYAS
ncbi:MAG: hypothetical protein R2799_11425 [Crocinitomicaceae bacterium]